MKASQISEYEDLINYVTKPLLAVRSDLICKGYTDEESSHAIALSLPVCIKAALLDSVKREYISNCLDGK